MLKKSVSMQQHLEQFLGKHRRVELKSDGNFVAKAVLVESVNQFYWKSCVGHSTSWNILEDISTIRPSGKTLRVYIVSASDISSFNMQYTNVNMQDSYVNMQLFYVNM